MGVGSMTAQPLGPSGALKVAMELIDAQAKHIQALERGHWSRETRTRVEELRDELEIVTAAERPDLTITHTETWKDGKLISDVETGRFDKAAEPLGTCPGVYPSAEEWQNAQQAASDGDPS